MAGTYWMLLATAAAAAREILEWILSNAFVSCAAQREIDRIDVERPDREPREHDGWKSMEDTKSRKKSKKEEGRNAVTAADWKVHELQQIHSPMMTAVSFTWFFLPIFFCSHFPYIIYVDKLHFIVVIC